MRIYLKNYSAKFHPDPIQNNGALGLFKELPQQEQQQDE